MARGIGSLIWLNMGTLLCPMRDCLLRFSSDALLGALVLMCQGQGDLGQPQEGQGGVVSTAFPVRTL